MSTFPLRAPILAELKFGGFHRAVNLVLSLIEVFEEAQRMAIDAQRRFPFAQWE